MSLVDTISNFSYLGFNYWWYVVIFLASFLEATPFFGLFVPGMSIVIAGGFMVKLGVLNIVDIIVVASLGAILGDLIGYFLGNKYGVSFLKKYGKYFFFRKKQFEKTKMLINNHAGKSLIIGRFNSLTRSFAPFIAGSMGTPFNRFLFFNVIGGVSWAVTFVLVGFIFGQSYEIIAHYIGRFITIAIIISIVIVYLYHFINKRKHIFKRYNLYVLILNLSSLYIFAKMIGSVVDKEIVARFDVFISHKMMLFWSLPLSDIAIFITNIMTPFNLFIISLILSGIFIIKKKPYYITLLITGITGGLVLQSIVKFFIHKERPLNILASISGYSFPSIYVIFTTIFFTILFYAFKNDIKSKMCRILFASSIIMTFLLIIASRLYLNIYWFSDMIAGFAVGIFWLTTLILVFKFILSVESSKIRKIEKYIHF